MRSITGGSGLVTYIARQHPHVMDQDRRVADTCAYFYIPASFAIRTGEAFEPQVV